MRSIGKMENDKVVLTTDKVVITTEGADNESYMDWLLRKKSDYLHAIINTYSLVTQYDANNDPNAFHHLLRDSYANLSPDELKIVALSVLAPSSDKICQRVIAIANPVILEALRMIPRFETANPAFFKTQPTIPKISGGWAFNSVLAAIGMDILSESHPVHTPFTFKMFSVLGLRAIEKNVDPFKQWFVTVVEEETAQLVSSIHESAKNGESISPDFRFYALKIFLRGFYPDANWSDAWIRGLSHQIEVVSNMAFECIMNPYANLDHLKKEANIKLDPFINEIMKQDQSFYLGKEYASEHISQLRSIIISLLFAGGDNIKKFLDHIFIEFGNDDIRSKYLSKNPSSEELTGLISEVSRLYTTIYAQPGKALDNFIIKYKGYIIEIKAGDELHYSTEEANRDKSEWGPFAGEFKPEAHYARSGLNPEQTFGSGARLCQGKRITKAIIKYLISQLLNEGFRWEATVDHKKNCHPTEFNFNNSVKGTIRYFFWMPKRTASPDDESLVSENKLPKV